MRQKHVPECIPATWFLCTTPPKCPKISACGGRCPLKARVFLYKTHPKSPKNFACGGHWGPSFRFAEPAPIGRSSAKRKNLMNPHWTERFSFSCLRRAKHIILVLPIVFIRKTIRKTYFSVPSDQTFLPVGSMPAAGGFFFKLIPLFEGKVYHFRGINRSLNEGKTMRGGRKRCTIFRGRLTAPERV